MTRKTLASIHMELGACPRAKAILLRARLYNLPLTDALTTTYSQCLYLLFNVYICTVVER